MSLSFFKKRFVVNFCIKVITQLPIVVSVCFGVIGLSHIVFCGHWLRNDKSIDYHQGLMLLKLSLVTQKDP